MHLYLDIEVQGAIAGALSGAPHSVSSSEPQISLLLLLLHSSVYYQVHLKVYSYFHFLITRILHTLSIEFILKAIFKSILKCISYTLSFKSQLHLLGELYVILLRSSKYIIDCTVKYNMIHANVSLI